MWPEKLTIIRYEDGGFSATQAVPPESAKFTQVYVPASALSDVWDEAIKTLMRAADECPVFVYHSARGRDFLIEALEHARDAALSAAKENEDERV